MYQYFCVAGGVIDVGDVGEEGDSSPGTFWSNFYSSMSDCFHPMTTLSKDSHEDDQLDDADGM